MQTAENRPEREDAYQPLGVTVLVPTYRRPRALASCLRGLSTQTRPPQEVVIVVRNDDIETATALEDMRAWAPKFRVVNVDEPGVVAAMQVGLQTSTSDITAIIDDDAVPRPDWLERIIQAFSKYTGVAGVGGRDNLYAPGGLVKGEAAVVGRVTWWGRHIGNHHLGYGEPRDVDVLKGVNCAYRSDVLRSVGFDSRLRGRGAQVHWELSLGLALRRSGWRLIYDPEIIVDHYPAVRHDSDQRDTFSFAARADEAHNETLVLLDHFRPLQRALFLAWAVLVGTRATPGVAQWFRLLALERRSVHLHVLATLAGRCAGISTWMKTRDRRPVAPRCPV